MKAAQTVERSIAVLATAVDNIEMAGKDKDKDDEAAKKSVIAVAATSKIVTNANHSALSRIATRQMKTKDSE